MAGQHAVAGVLEHPSKGVARVARLARSPQTAQGRQKIVVDETQERLACDVAVGGPGPPAQVVRQDWTVALLECFPLFLEVVERLEEQQPCQLGEAVQLTVQARVLTHDLTRLVDHRLEPGLDVLGGGLRWAHCGSCRLKAER